MTTIRRVNYGYFIRPAQETGTSQSRVEPCLGYLVDHPDGMVLMDTGMGIDPDVDAHYNPQRHALPTALAALGVGLDDIQIVVNCHLHFDHCGGNPELPHTEIVVQSTELELASNTPDYTLIKLVDAPGLRYRALKGEAEILKDLFVIPTPGHTPGHQSLVVRLGDGTVIVAGQSHDTASAYAADVLAWTASQESCDVLLPQLEPWIHRLQEFDPKRVVFAHDFAVWEP